MCAKLIVQKKCSLKIIEKSNLILNLTLRENILIPFVHVLPFSLIRCLLNQFSNRFITWTAIPNRVQCIKCSWSSSWGTSAREEDSDSSHHPPNLGLGHGARLFLQLDQIMDKVSMAFFDWSKIIIVWEFRFPFYSTFHFHNIKFSQKIPVSHKPHAVKHLKLLLILCIICFIIKKVTSGLGILVLDSKGG